MHYQIRKALCAAVILSLGFSPWVAAQTVVSNPPRSLSSVADGSAAGNDSTVTPSTHGTVNSSSVIFTSLTPQGTPGATTNSLSVPAPSPSSTAVSNSAALNTSTESNPGSAN